LEAANHRVDELQLNNKKLEEAVASLVFESQSIQREQQETLSLLEEARATITLLRQQLDEYASFAFVCAV
jgi:chromosome segregation ATPase